MSAFKVLKLRGLQLKVHEDTFLSGALSMFDWERSTTRVIQLSRLDPSEDKAMLKEDLERIGGDFSRAKSTVLKRK